MKRIIGLLAAVSLALAGIAAPAQAAEPIEAQAVFDCPDPAGSAKLNVCMYDWINYNYASGFFRRTNQDITAQPNDCMNINTLYWHDYVGTVGDAASSMVINSRYHASYQAGLVIEFYEWVNCNEAGRSFSAFVRGDTSDLVVIPNLADIGTRGGTVVQNEGSDFYNTIQSIRVGAPGS